MRTRQITVLSLSIAAALLVGASTAHAAFTTESCLAKKSGAQGNLQKCRATEEAKALQGKPADLAKCTTKFQEKIAKLSEKASEAGIGCRYGDNGNGTVSDYDTGLQWEKKVSPGGGAADPHDVDNVYSWGIFGGGGCAFSGCPNGEAYTDFLGRLNRCTRPSGFGFSDAGFAGHCDWRVPTIDEIETILDVSAAGCGSGSPCIDPVFGPTAATGYWSATTSTEDASSAWLVNFNNGSVGLNAKNIVRFPFRAVRGGL